MLHRRGNGSNLGLIKRDSDVYVSCLKHLQLEGVPTTWDGQDVESFLKGQGWTDASVFCILKQKEEVVVLEG